MSYLVLARKWRPRKFDELVGQDLRRALVNALDSGRIQHAFLFTGTRGVGKTTIARIFAKSLICEKGVSSKPCGECAACTDIDAGRFVDLLEVDAASRMTIKFMKSASLTHVCGYATFISNFEKLSSRISFLRIRRCYFDQIARSIDG